MEHFTKNLETLQKLLTESNGAFVHFGNEQYRFTQQATVTPEEIADFEAQLSCPKLSKLSSLPWELAPFLKTN